MITRDINCQLVNSESTMECLRNVSYQTFLDLDVPTPLYSYSFGPVVDGNIVEEDPAKLIQKVTEGQRNITTMAYMTGMTKNEGFRYLSSSVDIVGRIEQNVYEQTLHGFVQNNFGSNRIASGVIRDTISYEYTDWGSGPMNSYTMTSSLQDIITDHQWVTPAVQTLKQLDKAKMTSYFYLFTHRPRGSPNPRWAGPVHLEELPFVFGAPLHSTPLGVFKSNYTKADSHISLALMTYWTNFIKTGNPNLPTSQASTDFHRHFGPSFEYENSDRWPAYTNTHQNIVYLTSKPRIRDFYRVHEISLWEHLIPQLESRLSIDEPTSRIPLDTNTRDTTTPGTLQSTLTDSNLYLHISTQPAITDYGTTTVSAGIINNTHRHGYKIELSIVLAAGGLLLLINLIILGVIYYLRDRKKMESRLAAKYLAHLEEIKKKKANGRGFMQTTPDSGIGFATLLNAQNGKGANSTIGTGSHQSSRDGTIRINEDGDIEFEV
ncbi:putative neuroligin-4, Y-linked isoform X1 [Apostichopus japonicus]|uniref:Putative neuroligin-4, Y-linked isoform X1 n=1 Tax=Stichopus japonicus TaxID=307972 RepID=A0A2G8JJ18_STIJA|nr:putative neuroligin-4, Y-linked isoform X1 [Apostichopus japonicus]